MTRKNLIAPMIDAMLPKRRQGALPNVTACPFCGANMSQTGHSKHRDACRQAFRDAPPQAADFAQDEGGGYNKDGTFPQT